jgi:hypothetical protein
MSHGNDLSSGNQSPDMGLLPFVHRGPRTSQFPKATRKLSYGALKMAAVMGAHCHLPMFTHPRSPPGLSGLDWRIVCARGVQRGQTGGGLNGAFQQREGGGVNTGKGGRKKFK